jgi:hypothetical protein
MTDCPCLDGGLPRPYQFYYLYDILVPVPRPEKPASLPGAFGRRVEPLALLVFFTCWAVGGAGGRVVRLLRWSLVIAGSNPASPTNSTTIRAFLECHDPRPQAALYGVPHSPVRFLGHLPGKWVHSCPPFMSPPSPPVLNPPVSVETEEGSPLRRPECLWARRPDNRQGTGMRM